MPRVDVQFDHAILLLPYRTVMTLPEWITNNFIVGMKGYHADNQTVHRLIFFKDGCYLELLAFIHDDPVKAAGHGWDKDFGIVDFALTTRRLFDHKDLRGRLQQSGTNISYANPTGGGRILPDGSNVEWQVVLPHGIERGAVPFWCHDVTPREARVPGTEGITQHPCGAIGVAGISIDIRETDFDRVQTALAVVIGGDRNCVSFEVGTPYDIGKLVRPDIRLRKHLTGDKEQLHLSLALYNPRTPVPTAIEQRVGSGAISIRFES